MACTFLATITGYHTRMTVDTERIMKIGLDLAGWKKLPADSAVHVRGRGIRKVLMAIDVSAAEIALAKSLGCDAVIAHHPIGVAAINFYRVFDRHIEFMIEHSVPRDIAKMAVKKLQERVETRSHADIYSQTVESARLMKMPLVNIHQPCDEYMRQVILESIQSSKKVEYVTDIVKSVGRIPEFKNAKTKVKVVLGSEKNRAGHWALVVAAGTNGGYHIAKAYYTHKVSTLIYLHVDYGDLVKMREEKLDGNLVILGHLAGDSIGMNGLAARLEKEGVDTVRLGILPGR